VAAGRLEVTDRAAAMIAPSDSLHPSEGGQPHHGGPRAQKHLRVVDDDAYGDWEAVYRDNVTRIYRLMYAKVGNRADAEDLTSEVFHTALGPLRLSSSRGEVRAYLLMTARTALAGYWRRRLGQPVTAIDPEFDIAALSDEPELPSQAPEQADRILSALPERYRRILELRFLEACTLKEAAQAMQISLGNAKVLQHRALRMAAKIDPAVAS
jgi:RNA polymerase sigma factor (sigma-70 family)